MAEQLNLTTPITYPATTFYRISALHLDWDGQRITVVLRGSDGSITSHMYTSDQAVTLMRALNTANLSTKSLHRRILERLHQDNVLTGTVSGMPI